MTGAELTAPQAIRRTHAWFEQNSGWSPPGEGTLREWLADGVCRAPDDCIVGPAEVCPHGLASWWLVLRTLDRPEGGREATPAGCAPAGSAPTGSAPAGSASTGCAPTGSAPAGSAPTGSALPPDRLVPHPDRADPGRTPGYVAIIDAHHRALLAGEAGYLDPSTGLFVLTARTLWDRKRCCDQGCRHCPYAER